MSMAAVRLAIKDFIDNANVPGISKVYKAQPDFIDGKQWRLSDDQGSNSIVFVHLEIVDDERISLPAVKGQLFVHYQVYLAVIYQYLKRSARSSTLTERDDWVDPLDETLHGIRRAIIGDPNLGTKVPGGGNPLIFEAGQRGDGGIRIHTPLPRQTPGKILSWSTIEFRADELETG